jgi:hypothetical protein
MITDDNLGLRHNACSRCRHVARRDLEGSGKAHDLKGACPVFKILTYGEITRIVAWLTEEFRRHLADRDMILVFNLYKS